MPGQASNQASGGAAQQGAVPPSSAAVQPGQAGQAAADALTAKLGPRLPTNFILTFPPNAWPLIRAEGARGANGLSLRLTADVKDEVRLKGAVSSLRDALEAAGHSVDAIVVLTDGE